MDIKEIINVLKNYSNNNFPKDAVEQARQHKYEISKILLDDLKEITKKPDIIFENDNIYDFHFYLLAEFREKKAYPIIIEILNKLDEEDLDYLLGDILTENMASILASTFNGDLILLYNIIENKEKDEFLRASVLDALAILYNKKIINKNNFIDYLNKLLGQYENNDDFIILEIIHIVSDLKIYELVPQIEKLFENQKIDERYESIEDFKESLNNHFYYHQEYDYITDCISSMSWIYRYSFESTNTKIGRNEPCPCGSGKKYKKCCGK